MPPPPAEATPDSFVAGGAGDIGRGQRRVRRLADTGPHERRADPVEQVLAGGLGGGETECEGAQVVLRDDVDHDRRRVAEPGQHLGDALGSAAHDVEGESGDAVGLPATGRLLFDVGAQVRVREAEGGVSRELGLGDRGEAVGGAVAETGNSEELVRSAAVSSARLRVLVSS